jgi:hypothetical protein
MKYMEGNDPVVASSSHATLGFTIDYKVASESISLKLKVHGVAISMQTTVIEMGMEFGQFLEF